MIITIGRRSRLKNRPRNCSKAHTTLLTRSLSRYANPIENVIPIGVTQQSQVMGVCTCLFCKYCLLKTPNDMHCITSLHLGDTKTDHVPQIHPLIYASEYIDHVQEASLDVAFQYHFL